MKIDSVFDAGQTVGSNMLHFVKKREATYINFSLSLAYRMFALSKDATNWNLFNNRSFFSNSLLTVVTNKHQY